MTLFLVGGGPDAFDAPSGHLDEVYDQFVAHAKRRTGRIAIALLGSEDEVGGYLKDYVHPLLSRWADAEIIPIYLRDADDDEPTLWPDDFAKLAGLVVAGGYTLGYLEALIPQREAISLLVRGGVPYLGFSAGAMIVSRHAIVGGYKHNGRQIAPDIASEGTEELDIRDGLALIGPTVETHADAWSTLGVALAALEASQSRTAVAIDENTCLIVDPGSGLSHTRGRGRVHWISREGSHIVVSHEVAPVNRTPDSDAVPAPDAPPSGSTSHPPKPSELPKHPPTPTTPVPPQDTPEAEATQPEGGASAPEWETNQPEAEASQPEAETSGSDSEAASLPRAQEPE